MERFQTSRKYRITLLCLSMVAILLTASASWAWLAINRSVHEDGYGLSVTVSPNLVVSSTVEGITAMKADLTGNDRILYVDSTKSFIPCTHYQNGAPLSDLHYLKNTADVDRSSGLAESPDLRPVAGAVGDAFYGETTAYVASTDAALSNCLLRITIDTEETIDASTYSQAAASVDIYMNNTFYGTLNLAGLDAKINNATTAKNHLDLSLEGNAVPLNTQGYLTFRFVFYFDGALLKSSDTAFVNSDTVSPADLKLSLRISAVDLSEIS